MWRQRLRPLALTIFLHASYRRLTLSTAHDRRLLHGPGIHGGFDPTRVRRGRGGREVMARCPTEQDGRDAASWLVDRVSRLRPGLAVSTDVEPGGGQFLLVLRAGGNR